MGSRTHNTSYGHAHHSLHLLRPPTLPLPPPPLPTTCLVLLLSHQCERPFTSPSVHHRQRYAILYLSVVHRDICIAVQLIYFSPVSRQRKNSCFSCSIFPISSKSCIKYYLKINKERRKQIVSKNKTNHAIPTELVTTPKYIW